MTTPATYPDLAGRVAVVTGGSRGIGAAIGRALAAQRARVVVTGRDHAALHAVSAQISELGGHAHPVVAELTDPDQVERLRIEAEQTFGPVELLAVAAGGSGEPASITELSLDDWRHTVDANLTTAFLTLRTFLPSMIERQRGSVVTMSSTAGRLPSPSSPAYGAANAGLQMLTRQAALQVAPHNVRVNAIAPGAVLTDRLTQMPAHVRDGRRRATSPRPPRRPRRHRSRRTVPAQRCLVVDHRDHPRCQSGLPKIMSTRATESGG